jgi:hypothetical protein
MLQRIAMGQARFNVPGLTPDSRGVVAGRQMALRFPALDRLVGFLRLWSAEQPLDDLQPGLRIVQARAAGGTRDLLVLAPIASPALADVVARTSRTAGGQCFTGTGKHFVLYRDGRAPLGYDAAALAGDTADLLLYAEDHTLSYSTLAELPVDKLLLRLDLERDPLGAAPAGDVLYLMVRRGLGPVVIEYLHRAKRGAGSMRASAALCEPSAEGAFHRARTFWLVRVDEAPRRLAKVLSGTPGMVPFAPVADNIAVAIGYRHAVHLEACKTVFPLEALFLFAPAPDGVTVVNPAPPLTPVADLVRLRGAWSGGSGDLTALTAAKPAARVDLVVPLRLEPAPTSLGRAVAALVPWDNAGWLRSICYAMPPSALRGYRLAVLDRGLLVVAPAALDGLPIGRLLHAAAPGVLVPMGMELRPAVSPEQLAGRLGATGGAVVVFPDPDDAPFRVPADALEPLEARSLADPRLMELAAPRILDVSRPRTDAPDVEIENQPLGPLPLWRLGR